MMKRFIAWVLVIILLVSFAVPAFAHDRKDHDKDINDVLFNNGSFPGYSKKGKNLKDLENAVALCIDQFNGSDYRLLADLRDHGIKGIPKDIKTIDLIKVNAYTHRGFTHMGWNYHYDDDEEWEKKWQMRRKILLQTVEEVFGFRSKTKMVGFFKFEKVYDDQCDAFAAFLYYLHILSDYKYYDGDKKDTLTNQVMPLVASTDSEEGDIFSELERVLPIVFAASVKDKDYFGLETTIKMLETDARSLEYVDDENFQQHHDVVVKLFEHLESKVPGMLQKEPFFSKVFGD